MVLEIQEYAPVQSIFDPALVFTQYRAQLTFRDTVVGGVPQKPEIIEAWLRQRIVGGDKELALMLRKTLEDLEIEVPENPTHEDIIEAAKSIAATRNGNTFRRTKDGLVLAGYQVKAMLKESTSILYPGGMGGHKWGPTRKSPRSLLAERVFVDEGYIPLGRREPDGTMTVVGHPDTPRGKRATLTYYDYCTQPVIDIVFSSSEDAIEPEQWVRILVQGERLGLGAIRSMGYGTFAVTDFGQV